tara:strand:+ start:34 stop:744 length:711 start_codon:yes stop_codon:yes gene_type:complete
MCTVSFVKVKNKVIITSNRDEKVVRPNAINPKNYIVNGKNVIYPKDPKAGGTWYAVDENGTILVLLNGADEKHISKLTYRRSRGLIVLDIISDVSPKDFWGQIDLDNIEPFTLVLFQNAVLFQLRWDGLKKDSVVLNADVKHIWSSATLYPNEIRKERADLFYSFLEENGVISEKEMYHFHRYTDVDNLQNGLVINRNNEMKTLSITQAITEQNKVAILHYDLISQKESCTSFIIV